MIRIEAKPYLMENGIQNYSWGQKGNKSFITKLVNEKVDPEKPYAELWIGAHPKLSSKIAGEELNIVLEETGKEILGDYLNTKYNSTLPFLLKVLSAGEALSIQSHPDKEKAVKLHQKDPENYPDDNHKPEIAIAIDYLKALIGIKNKEELQKTFTEYPELKALLGNRALKEFNEAEDSADAKKIIFEQVLNSPEMNISSAVQSLALKIGSKNIKTPTEKIFLEMREKHSSKDAGLIFIFLLNYFELKKGEGVYLKAGVPHAYLEGNIIECMANSDNVIRAGLTPKFTDKQALIDSTDYYFDKVEVIKENTELDIFEYKTSVKEFQVNRINLAAGKKIFCKTGNQVEVLLVLNGKIKINAAESFEFKKGDSVLVPAIVGEYTIESDSDCSVFKVEVPV